MDKAVMSVRMQKWAAIIQEAATCGMTKTEYCARKGIDRRQFFHWQKVIREYIPDFDTKTGPIHYIPMDWACFTNAQLHS